MVTMATASLKHLSKLNGKMAVLEAFSHNVKYKYKISICSKASIFICFALSVTIVFPFLLAYRSQGFWLKSATYQEQPDVKFKHDYLLIVETDRLDVQIICTTYTQLKEIMPDLRDCSMVKSREIDNNKDGKNDELFLELQVPLQNTDAVYAIKLFILFDYRLYKLSSLAMDSMAYVAYGSSLPGYRFDVFADLRLVQKSLLSNRGRNSRHNQTIIDGDAILQGDFDLRSVIRDYSSRNVSTHLRNVYPLWTPGRASDQPFTVSATIYYPEETVVYRPGFWQVIKHSWIQYLSLLAVVGFVMQYVTEYVFRNQLVVSARIEPWRNKRPN